MSAGNILFSFYDPKVFKNVLKVCVYVCAVSAAVLAEASLSGVQNKRKQKREASDNVSSWTINKPHEGRK